MALGRRDLIRMAVAAPLGFFATRALATAADTVTRLAPDLRPAGGGTSATRCALCGAADHSMLDPQCPAARRVT